jgi:hypothetical protein
MKLEPGQIIEGVMSSNLLPLLSIFPAEQI